MGLPGHVSGWWSCLSLRQTKYPLCLSEEQMLRKHLVPCGKMSRFKRFDTLFDTCSIVTVIITILHYNNYNNNYNNTNLRFIYIYSEVRNSLV